MPPLDHHHLIRAYADVRQPRWPSLEACLLDPARGGLIRARAHQLAHGTPPAPAAPAGLPARAPPSGLRGPFAPLHPPPAHDAKRAAAGDTDPDTDPDLDEDPT